MKILWATPYCEASAIGRFSQAVVGELRQRGHHVAIYRTEVGAAAALPPRDEVGVLAANSQEELDWVVQADLIIANVGDHYPYHGRLFKLRAMRPYVAVLHDWCLISLFLGWLEAEGKSHEISRIVAGMYGKEAGERCAAADWTSIHEQSAREFPMTEWMVGDTLGAVIHSKFYGSRVVAASSGPVHKLSLAYPVKPIAPHDASAAGRDERFCVRTFGMVNRNKRIEWVIRALASDPVLAKVADYRVLGPCDEQERSRLEGIAEEVGFHGLVIEGRVTEARLREGLAEADVICCLREPALEGASASAIEGMQSGAPVIVSDAGFYAELPDEMVLKVPAGGNEATLRRHLLFAYSEPEAARAIAERAGRWAAEEFSAPRYVEGLERIMPDYVQAEPYIRTAQMLGRQLGKMGFPGASPAVRRLSRTLEQMFAL